MGGSNTGDDIVIGEANFGQNDTALTLDPINPVGDTSTVLRLGPSLNPGSVKVTGLDARGNAGGAGVIGRDSGKPSAGVQGEGSDGYGVVGRSQKGTGVCAISFGSDMPALYAEAQGSIAFHAVSGSGVGVYSATAFQRAAVFQCGQGAGWYVEHTDGNHPQVRIVPSTHKTFPTYGIMGDLFMHLSHEKLPQVRLFLCVGHADTAPLWKEVQLSATNHPGGTPTP